MLTRTLIIGVNVGTGIITARFLGAQGRGEQAAMILWPIFLANTLTFGLPTAVIYNFRKYPKDRSKLFAAALLLGTIAGLAATVLGIVLMPTLLKNYSESSIGFARLLMLNSPIVLVQLIVLSALEANGDFSASNRLRLLIPTLTLLLLIGLLFTNSLNPYTSALAYIVNGIPVFFWTLIQLWRKIRPQWQDLYRATKLLISYGLRSYGVSVLGTLASNIDQALVVGFLEPAAMGTYVVALSLSKILNIFHNSLSTVLFPSAAARPLEEIIAMTGRAVRLNIASMILIGSAVIVASPLLLNLLYGSEFISAVPVLRILIIGVVVNGAAMILAQAFMASGSPGVVTALQGVGLALNVPLMVVLIPPLGLTGAALSLLLSTTARLIFILFLFPTVLKRNPPSLIINREDIIYLKQKLSASL
ncbi:MAG: oligosaccharide flippase family protein [Phormidesmis sp.]